MSKPIKNYEDAAELIVSFSRNQILITNQANRRSGQISKSALKEERHLVDRLLSAMPIEEHTESEIDAIIRRIS